MVPCAVQPICFNSGHLYHWEIRFFSICFSDAFGFRFLQHALHLLSLGSCRDCLLTLLLLLVLPACPLCLPIAQFCFRFTAVSTAPKTLGRVTKQMVVRGPTRGAQRGQASVSAALVLFAASEVQLESTAPSTALSGCQQLLVYRQQPVRASHVGTCCHSVPALLFLLGEKASGLTKNWRGRRKGSLGMENRALILLQITSCL